MSDFWLEANLFGVCFIALAGSALGLLGLLGLIGRLVRSAVVPLFLAGLLAGLAAVLKLAGMPAGFWLVPLVLAALCVALGAFHYSHLAAILPYLLNRAQAARLHWIALVVASPLTAVSWAWTALPETEETDLSFASQHADRPAPAIGVIVRAAQTDAGHTIPLFQRPVHVADTELVAADKASFTAFVGQALRTAPPCEDYNCHGYVFTGGRFGIHNQDVDSIVEDNGYQPITDPRPEDLVVYRFEGNVTHTGIVRTAGPGQPLLVESKWGRFAGRYVHAPEAQPCAGRPCYYRSGRHGHLLRGLEDTLPASEPAGSASH